MTEAFVSSVSKVLDEIENELIREQCEVESHCEILKSFHSPVEKLKRSSLKAEWCLPKAGYEPKRIEASVKSKPVKYKGIDDLLDRVASDDSVDERTALEQVKIEGATSEMIDGISLLNNYLQTRKNQAKKEDEFVKKLSKRYDDMFEKEAAAFSSNENLIRFINAAAKEKPPPLPIKPQKDICDPETVNRNIQKQKAEIQSRINRSMLDGLTEKVPAKHLPSLYRCVSALENIMELKAPVIVKEQF